MLRNGAISIALFAVVASATAAQWQSIAHSDAFNLSVDRSSIQWSGRVVRVWIKMDYTIPTPMVTDGTVGTKWLGRAIINCSTRQVASESQTGFNNGKTVMSEWGNPGFFVDIMPDTPVETVAGTLCRGGF